MSIKIVFTFVLFTSSLFAQTAQKNIYNYNNPITCEYLYEGIIDSLLYKYENGRLVIIPEKWRKNKMKKLLVNKKVYYVSNRLANLIKETLSKNDCQGIEILPLDEAV